VWIAPTYLQYRLILGIEDYRLKCSQKKAEPNDPAFEILDK